MCACVQELGSLHPAIHPLRRWFCRERSQPTWQWSAYNQVCCGKYPTFRTAPKQFLNSSLMWWVWGNEGGANLTLLSHWRLWWDPQMQALWNGKGTYLHEEVGNKLKVKFAFDSHQMWKDHCTLPKPKFVPNVQKLCPCHLNMTFSKPNSWAFWRLLSLDVAWPLPEGILLQESC